MIRDLLPRRDPSENGTESEPTEDASGADEEDKDTGPEEMSDASAESTVAVDYERDEEALRDIPDIHQTVVSPSTITEQPGRLQTEGGQAQTIWVGEFPDAPSDGFLEPLYAAAETRQTDISIHIDPRDTQATLNSLENKIEDLEADYEYLQEKHRASARGVQRDLEDHQEMYDVLRNTAMQAFDVSMYLTLRDDERETLPTEAVTTRLRQAPTNLTPIVPRLAQLQAFTAASPVARDRGVEALNSRTPMLGGAVGAMFPFVAGAFAEPGIEYGTYALNASPLILDRFRRETGYCAMVIGRLGAGKSFATKLRLLRRAMFDGETVIIMLDPMRGFTSVAEALNAECVTVGGRQGLNPLELKQTPEDVLSAADDIDPWGEQISWVMTFFATFFDQVADHSLGERSQTLRRAVQEAYNAQGITRDPTTHSRESPTIQDVIDVLEGMVEDPESFGYATTGEQEAVRTDAQSLLKDLRPSFREDGELANLARQSEFNLDSKALYLDLHQEEGTQGRAETSLMMQVLFNSVYERAKQTDKKVVFCIDEAHYLMNDAVSLDFLETAVRHSRHFDLSLEFITQTGGEFTLTPEAQTIANLCSVSVLHRINEEEEKIARWFDLNDRQVDWVTTAKAGEEEDGYAEALVGIDQEGWFPVRIRASDAEARVIDG
ncbi:VirB4 family type IV secretion system protein [Salinirussus salinus]|uniref:VirB4 family type IV secretion system protein n=1 Tax=Salinirussus salinus TaxID=1198300 RepID=UPI001356A10C|nr:ATP-binding protein [Salinirussus salinus]